jgi:hypothetical protein
MKVCDFNHLIFYAKNHYENGDIVEDVRRIMAIRCGLEIEHMRDRDIWRCAVHALEEHCPDAIGRVMAEMFEPLVGEIVGGFVFPGSPEDTRRLCPLGRALYLVTAELMKLKVKDKDGNIILELGEVDEAILPLGEMAEKRQIELEAAQ